MLKSTITIIILSTFLGLFAGAHASHIRVHHAMREIASRRCCGISIKTFRSATQVLLNRRTKTSPFRGVLDDLDGICDRFFELCWFPEPNSIKTATDAQLYVISLFDEVYWCGRDLVFYARRHRHYREGQEQARIAMAARGSGRFHNTSRETQFAESLIYLGMYSDAENVLKNLLPVEMTIGESDCPKPFRHFRQELLGQALLGQQKYREAADVLKNPAVETDFDSLTYLRGIALLALHRDRESLQAFSSQKNECQNLYMELCSPLSIDKARKYKVMKLAVKYSEDTIGANDDVPALNCCHCLESQRF